MIYGFREEIRADGRIGNSVAVCDFICTKKIQSLHEKTLPFQAASEKQLFLNYRSSQ